MSVLTDRTAIAGIFAAFDATNSTPPEAVADAHERLTALTARYADRPRLDPEALALAVIAALESGTDPATSAEVGAVLAAQTLASRHPLATEVAAVLADTLRAACRDQAATIVGAWRPAFDRAAADLTEAHAELGPIDLTDTGTIVRRGPEATAAWSQAQRSVTTVAAVANGWSALVSFTTRALPSKRNRLLHIADASPAQWLDLDLDDHAADPWAALGLGLNLRLPTIDEHRANVGAIEAARRDRTAAVADAQLARTTGRLPTPLVRSPPIPVQ